MARTALRLLAILVLTALWLATQAGAAMGAAPSFETWSDPPSDDFVADCGTYEIREVSTFSARAIAYADGTVRVHATIDGWLYRTDDPATVIGREHARTVRLIEGSVAKVTGNRWHVVIYGDGMGVHDVGRLIFNFETGELFAESGQHPVFHGDFDFASLCE